MEELSETDYKVASQNGIPRSYAHTRRHQLGWSVKRAITEPVKTYPKLWNKYRSQCESIGLSRTGFMKRVHSGMNPELASTVVVQRHTGVRRQIHENHSNGHIR